MRWEKIFFGFLLRFLIFVKFLLVIYIGSCNKFFLFCIIELLFGLLSCIFVWCRDYILVYRVVGIVVGRLVRYVVVVMWYGIADFFVSIRIGRIIIMCVVSYKWVCSRFDRIAFYRRCIVRRSLNIVSVKSRRLLFYSFFLVLVV